MSTPAPVLGPAAPAEQQRWRDDEHLRLLSIFHFIMGGLALLVLPFLMMHFVFFVTVVANVDAWPQGKAPPIPREMIGVMMVMDSVIGLLTLAIAGGNILSGRFLRRKTHRVFSLVIAGLDCLSIPWGTALGVFTIVVLTRPSVRKEYEAGSRASC